ncbi:MAG: hypothetical protein WA921_14870, partial [Ahrensia sp.]
PTPSHMRAYLYRNRTTPLRHTLRLVSFDVFRTLGVSGVMPIKPDEIFARVDELKAADWVLFPQEWQLSTLVHALHCRVFPSVPSYRFGQDKVQFTRAMMALNPARMPETLILPLTPQAVQTAIDRFGFPFVVKHPKSARGEGVFRIENRSQLTELLPSLDVLYAQECLEITRDLRVVWIGDRVVTAYWRQNAEGFHNNIAMGGVVDFEDVPAEPLELVRFVATQLGIDHGGFDLVESDGHWMFLEVNVRFGNTGLKAAGINLAQIIEDWLVQNTPHTNDTDDDPLPLAG